MTVEEYEVINVRLTKEQADAVRRIAARTGNPVAAIIRASVQDSIDRDEQRTPRVSDPRPVQEAA